jgi:hypothetical protein
MTKQLSIVAALVLAVACKTESAAPSTAAPAGDDTTKARSAKIDVKPVPPALPEAAPSEDPQASWPRGERRRGGGDRDEWRKRREARIDTNSDGVISDQERAAAMEQRRSAMRTRLDTDDDGVVSDEERAAAMQQRLSAMRTRLDSNDDGKLSSDELASAPRRMRFDDPTAIDTNHDNDISDDELAAAMKARRDQRRQDRAGSAATP